MRSRGELLNAGQAMKARNSAKARWMERASVSLSTPKRRMKGSGDAYHSWNSAQASAVPKISCLAKPVGSRRPVSTSATSSCSSAEAFSMSVAMVLLLRNKKGAKPWLRPRVIALAHGRTYLIQPFSL